MFGFLKKLNCVHEPKILSCHKLKSNQPIPTEATNIYMDELAKAFMQEKVVQIVTCTKCGKVWHFCDALH